MEKNLQADTETLMQICINRYMKNFWIKKKQIVSSSVNLVHKFVKFLIFSR